MGISVPLRLPGQRAGASVREHLLPGVWGVADPAAGVERDSEQVEEREVPPVWADHFGGCQRRGHLNESSIDLSAAL